MVRRDWTKVRQNTAGQAWNPKFPFLAFTSHCRGCRLLRVWDPLPYGFAGCSLHGLSQAVFPCCLQLPWAGIPHYWHHYLTEVSSIVWLQFHSFMPYQRQWPCHLFPGLLGFLLKSQWKPLRPLSSCNEYFILLVKNNVSANEHLIL
jgi:hypothetical protein